eukprot:1938418-Prymnesium_polylepis.1
MVSRLLCRRLGVCCQTAAQAGQRHRNERRELRSCLHRAFEPTYPAAPGRLAALRKPAVSH